MSASTERYLAYWQKFAQKHHANLDVMKREFHLIQRAWDTLTSQEDLSITPDKREKIILDLMFSADYFLEYSGLYHENIRWISRALQAAKETKQPVLIARLGQDLGWCYRELGDLDKALNYLELALALRKKFGPKEGEANTLNMIGGVNIPFLVPLGSGKIRHV
ncbi:tetratricopeptide repeat protein [bacterium]|nr:tetratricopeptide repeat protein [bacterium]